MRRDYKIKFTDKLNLAKVHRLKGLTSPYIIFYLHFLNLNNILTLPKLSPSLKLGLIWHDVCWPCFLPARFTRIWALVYEIKTNASRLCNFIKKETMAQLFSCEFCKISKKSFSQNNSCSLGDCCVFLLIFLSPFFHLFVASYKYLPYTQLVCVTT